MRFSLILVAWKYVFTELELLDESGFWLPAVSGFLKPCLI